MQRDLIIKAVWADWILTADSSCLCSHPTQMHLKVGGAQVWQALSHVLLTPQPQGLCFNNAHTPHLEQCFVQMLLQLVVMPQTLALVLSDVHVVYIGYCVHDLSSLPVDVDMTSRSHQLWFLLEK